MTDIEKMIIDECATDATLTKSINIGIALGETTEQLLVRVEKRRSSIASKKFIAKVRENAQQKANVITDDALDGLQTVADIADEIIGAVFGTSTKDSPSVSTKDTPSVSVPVLSKEFVVERLDNEILTLLKDILLADTDFLECLGYDEDEINDLSFEDYRTMMVDFNEAIEEMKKKKRNVFVGRAIQLRSTIHSLSVSVESIGHKALSYIVNTYK